MNNRETKQEWVVVDETAPLPPRSRQDLAKEAVMLVPNIVKLLSRLLRDRRVPVRRKVFIAAVLGYVISPVDLIPDFVIGAIPVEDHWLAINCCHMGLAAIAGFMIYFLPVGN